MKISNEGLELITSFEGYHRALPDGSCTTYRCPANVLTIGYGCTEGIREGEVWTKSQAQERFRSELAKHEAAVIRLAKVHINQNQFDALVSFSYNCGIGALSTSTLLKKLNAGDFDGAAREFGKWNKGGGKVLAGLVRRRAAEAALFRKPSKPSADPDMAQAVDVPKEPMAPATKMTIAAGTGSVITAIPSVPQSWAESISSVQTWQTAGEKVLGFGKAAIANPMLAGVLAIVIAAIWFWPQIHSFARGK